MSDNNDGDDTEYRPTDWLASTGLSYGIGHTEEQAIQACLRWDGPWSDGDGPIEVAVWELYADSWEKHGVTGPERGAETLSFTRYVIPLDEAYDAHETAEVASRKLNRALSEAEEVEQADDA